MSDHALLLNKIRRLSIALGISGAMNIGVLGLLAYTMSHERFPTPYCELKPASGNQLQTPLADFRGSAEVITQLYRLPFSELVSRLDHTQLIENGYTERDLVLACMVSFYYFDLSRALGVENLERQKRLFTWRNKATEEQVILTVFNGLTPQQFETIQQFAKREQWPLTPEGLFLALQKQKQRQNIDPSLLETFTLTPDFWTLELLFNRSSAQVRKQKLLELVLDGDWPLFKQFVDHQRHLQDLSEARRQKLLLDYLKEGSESAAELLLQTEWEFAVKKMDDAQVVILLQLLPKHVESEKYAKEMLVSPRSLGVWQQASLRLYEYAGESIPKNWNYQTSLARFAPEKVAESRPSASLEKLLVKQVEPAKAKAVVSKPGPIIKAASPKSKAPLPDYRLYIVQEGDSLWKISRRFGVDIEALKQRNHIQSNAIKPGIVLRIP